MAVQVDPAIIRAVFGGMSIRKAAMQFGVCRTTISNRLMDPFPNNPGGKPIFTKYEESVFVAMVDGFAEIKLPLTSTTKFLQLVRLEAERKR